LPNPKRNASTQRRSKFAKLPVTWAFILTLDEAIAARKEAEEQFIKPLQEKWKIEDERRRKGSRHRKKTNEESE